LRITICCLPQKDRRAVPLEPAAKEEIIAALQVSDMLI
jgi:hypothetical protein